MLIILSPPWFQNEKWPFCHRSWKALSKQEWDFFVPLPVLTVCPLQARQPLKWGHPSFVTWKLDSLKSSLQQSRDLQLHGEVCHLPRVLLIFTLQQYNQRKSALWFYSTGTKGMSDIEKKLKSRALTPGLRSAASLPTDGHSKSGTGMC